MIFCDTVNISNMKSINAIFRVLCILATAFMIGYWLYKFQKNEDITLVEYKPVDELHEAVIWPELSFCFRGPFLNERLSNISNGLNKIDYYQYLIGQKNYGKTYHDISYENVTLNLFDYFSYISIHWKSIDDNFIDNCTSIQDCPYFKFKNNYNGVLLEGFYKCFGLEINQEYAKDIAYYYLKFESTLRNVTREVESALLSFNLPNQFTRNFGGNQPVNWGNYDKSGVQIIEITSVELLKRRNKIQEPCVDDWKSYDKNLELKHLEFVGCRSPYQKLSKNFEICNTTEKLKEVLFDGLKLAHDYPSPCLEMPNLAYRYGKTESNAYMTDGVKFYVSYPDKWKIITQSQKVDVHTLIGNMGGYIGLFLGKKIDKSL